MPENQTTYSLCENPTHTVWFETTAGRVRIELDLSRLLKLRGIINRAIVDAEAARPSGQMNWSR
jgi:hypothetical protein